MTNTTQTSWKENMNYLPKAYHFTDAYQPAEEWWDWKGNRIHLDTFRNPQAPEKLSCSMEWVPTDVKSP